MYRLYACVCIALMLYFIYIIFRKTFFFTNLIFFKCYTYKHVCIINNKCNHFIFIYVTLEHKSSLKSLVYICSNNQQYIIWVTIIDFSFMPKIIRILRQCSMKNFCKFPTINISKLNFWLVICIAKNFIWTTLKMIFSIFRFFCTLRFLKYKCCPIITIHTSMEILFIKLSGDVYISISKNWPLWLLLCSRATYTYKLTNTWYTFYT